MKNIKVLYIAGEGRSGSTIIGNILGEAGNTFTVGEIMSAWNVDRKASRYCSCGREFDACPAWRTLMQTAFNVDTKGALKAPKATQFRNVFHSLYLYFLKPFHADELSFWEKIYQTVAEIHQTEWIIDESKNPNHLIILSQLKNVDLWVLHLVRDARAVAYSWQRQKKRSNQEGFMPVVGPRKAARRWVMKNLVISWLFQHHPRYHQMRYEDFSENPEMEIGAVLRWMGIEENLPFTDNLSIEIKKEHHLNVSNPIGSKRGQVEIKSDNEWKKNMTKKQYWLVTLFSLPVLLKYKYRIGR